VAVEQSSRAPAADGSSYRSLFVRYLAPQWRAAAGLLGLLLVTAGIQVAHPRLLATFVDAAGDNRPTATLTRLAVAFIVLALLGQLAGVLDTFLAQHVALVATNRLRADLTLHCLRLDLSFHASHRPGELIQRVEGDVAALANFLSRFLVAIAGNVLLLGGVVVMVSLVDWRLGLVLGALCVAIPSVGYRFRSVGKRYWQPYLEAQADQAGMLEEVLSATEDVRSAGAVAWALRRFTEHARTVLRRQQRAGMLGNLVGTLGGSAFGAGGILLLATATWLFTRGQATIGDVFLVFAYTQMLGDPIQALTRELQDLQTAGAAVVRIDELLLTTSNLPDAATTTNTTGTTAIPAGRPLRVEVDGVTFAYDNRGDDDTEAVLRDVSFTVEPGRMLGLLGRTGSGKTTIARLLVRFYDPQTGALRIGGVDVRDAALHDVRHHVALVTQDVQLFHATARDNLTLFDPAVDDRRITAAIDELGLDAWLSTLPNGLDSLVDASTGLSAGEAQLLAFARVLLRDPGLVILDEATARLDPATERHVEHAVARLFEGRTAVVIAHRLQTVLRADDILVLDDGRILEHGERTALMADPTSRFSSLLRTGMEEALQ
jgi:ABC-type multidrug transport system fused ATPase/permease subunit